MTSGPPASPRVHRLAEHLIRRACRHLPDDTRDDRYREWTAELHVILLDPGTRPRVRRAIRALLYAADQFRGARRLRETVGNPGTQLRRERRVSIPDMLGLALVNLSLAGMLLFSAQGSSGERWVAVSAGVGLLGQVISIYGPGQRRLYPSRFKGAAGRARLIRQLVLIAVILGLWVTVILNWTQEHGWWVVLAGVGMSGQTFLILRRGWQPRRRARGRVQLATAPYGLPSGHDRGHLPLENRGFPPMIMVPPMICTALRQVDVDARFNGAGRGRTGTTIRLGW